MGQRMSSLRRAIALDNPDQLEKILQKAGDGAPDLINEDYTSDCFFCCFRNVQSPLHTAMTYQGHPDKCPRAVEILVRYGADVNAQQEETGRTALHRAALQANIGMAQLFINHGADLEIVDYREELPIHSAAKSVRGWQEMNAKVVELLIKVSKPNQLNAKNKYGNTPLHLAAMADSHAVVVCLLEHGADTEVVNNNGHKPVDVALKTTRPLFNIDRGPKTI